MTDAPALGSIEPVGLRTARFVLDQPTLADVDRIAEYCRAPEFETFMSTPWPYERAHAVGFVEEFVPAGWSSGKEATWAIRDAGTRELLGVVGFRAREREIGFWLGAPHRGDGVMVEAAGAALDWVFSGGIPGLDQAVWLAVPGNLPSAGTARALGFRFVPDAAHERTIPLRSGMQGAAWFAVRGAFVDPADRDSWADVLP
ncbi:GNAT family N-acetyltransferase [Agromyces seonyuensis]|uniref:GNAT family N-acetyltransferase n=1 Tax=Agromyces seonyuensis TaxID=2662446 RepID=A0A6I4P4M3_9MICO|nr:GNAT family N-acetyltransferase [Agromyces seonyuensis]MWB99269.1 GNAT family N-acetyltransferase [Agromyces seonyuensis]